MRKNTLRSDMISVSTACAGVCTAEAPFTAGTMTGTHFSDDFKSSGLGRRVFEMPRSAGADLIVNVCGIADCPFFMLPSGRRSSGG